MLGLTIIKSYVNEQHIKALGKATPIQFGERGLNSMVYTKCCAVRVEANKVLHNAVKHSVYNIMQFLGLYISAKPHTY